MNKKRILELADTIGGLPTVDEDGSNDLAPDEPAFGMHFIDHDCGSPSCISGWGGHLWPEDAGSIHISLGLTEKQGLELIAPNNKYAYFSAAIDEPRFITSEHAAAVLRNLAETGEVDWTVGAGS